MRFTQLLTNKSTVVTAVIAAIAGFLVFGTLPLALAAVVAVYGYQLAKSFTVPGDGAVSTLANTVNGSYWLATAAVYAIGAFGLVSFGWPVVGVLVLGGAVALVTDVVSGLRASSNS